MADEAPRRPTSLGARGTTARRYSALQIRQSRELLQRISGARRAARFYPIGHPAFDEAIEKLQEAIDPYLREGVPIELGFVDGEILLGEQLLTEESVAHAELSSGLAELGVGSLAFTAGASAPELARAMRVLGLDPPALAEVGGLQAVLAAGEFTNVSIGSMRMVERSRAEQFTMPASAREAYRGSTALIHEFDGAVSGESGLESSKIDSAVRALVDNVLENRDAMVQLAGVREHDEYTYQHSANVAALALAIGSMISTDYSFLSSLGVGALLHDVGKLEVDRAIINKAGSLTPEEWEKMRRHPVEGAELVSTLHGVDKAAVVAIAEHHMRYDGAGYPSRTPAKAQHLVSRIVAVADAYDAMTSRRSYSEARLPDEAMRLLIENSGTALDPALVRLFVRLMGIYPPRSIVRLNGGELAIVIRANAKDPSRPVVRIVAAPSGAFIEATDIDLETTPELSVVVCVDPRSVNIDIDAYVH
jgi:putative nucleotidyltransferase with HDIG domain